MAKKPSHLLRSWVRNIIAGILAAVYLTALLGPLAPLGVHPEALAMARACSGDCDICGCSKEKREARSCCCSKKKEQEARLQEPKRPGVPDCCKSPPPATPEVVIASCGCPCDSNESLHHPGNKKTETLPYRFIEHTVVLLPDTPNPELPQLPPLLHLEPPDPPPRQA